MNEATDFVAFLLLRYWVRNIVLFTCCPSIILLFWKCLRLGWMGPWAPWSNEWYPCTWQGDWNWMAFKVPSNLSRSIIPSFYLEAGRRRQVMRKNRTLGNLSAVGAIITNQPLTKLTIFQYILFVCITTNSPRLIQDMSFLKLSKSIIIYIKLYIYTKYFFGFYYTCWLSYFLFFLWQNSFVN